MKKLVVPDVSFNALGPDGEMLPVSAVSQLCQIVSAPSTPDGVFTITDIRGRLPLLEKLEEAEKAGKKEVLLEDAEYAVLSEAAKASMWRGVSRAALELVEAVGAAETVEVAEDEKAV